MRSQKLPPPSQRFPRRFQFLQFRQKIRAGDVPHMLQVREEYTCQVPEQHPPCMPASHLPCLANNSQLRPARFSFPFDAPAAQQRCFRLIALLAGFRKGYERVRPEGYRLRFSVETVSKPPEFSANRRHDQKQPAAIKQLVGFCLRFGN